MPRERQHCGKVRADVPAVMRYRLAIGLKERLRYYRYDPVERFAHHVDAPFRRDNGAESLLTFMIYSTTGLVGAKRTSSTWRSRRGAEWRSCSSTGCDMEALRSRADANTFCAPT